MSNYAIGDLQGCYEELQILLEKISFNPQIDYLWFCGDLVNRGPDSLKCLLFLRSFQENCKIVLGNHDLHLLAVHEGVREMTPSDTFMDVLESSESETLMSWLKSLPFHVNEIVETKSGNFEFIMTHAGIAPHWSKDDLIRNSDELSLLLKGKDSKKFLEEIFGNYPFHPSQCKSKEDGLRLSINYLTRMRYLDCNGSLDLDFKGPIEEAPKELIPWFNLDLNIMQPDRQVLFGHWAAINGVTNQNQITALDTGCAWGNKLTALKLEDQEIYTCDKLN